MNWGHHDHMVHNPAITRKADGQLWDTEQMWLSGGSVQYGTCDSPYTDNLITRERNSTFRCYNYCKWSRYSSIAWKGIYAVRLVTIHEMALQLVVSRNWGLSSESCANQLYLVKALTGRFSEPSRSTFHMYFYPWRNGWEAIEYCTSQGVNTKVEWKITAYICRKPEVYEKMFCV